MAGSTRFEVAGSSPEGSAFASSYANAARGNYSSANLDRSGSFREGVESRMLNSGSGSVKGSASLLAEMPPSQYLALEPISLGDQKFTRTGEARKILGVSLGNSSEDHSFGGAHLKPSPLIASEELKRFKASVLDTSNKARDRAKRLHESIGKLDKYRHTILSRKRSNERSGGAGILKMGSQIHQNPPDITAQRLEDRPKHVVLNKRVRTSLADSEGRSTVIPRQPMIMDKDREMLRAASGGSGQVEEKIRGLPAAGEGWDKKMKRKRSVGTMVTRAMDGDRELKRAIHPKLGSDPRSRSTDAHGFGSGPSNGVPGIKLDGASQSTASNTRALHRNELEHASFSNDRRDRSAVLDKERAVSKGNNKLNVREDSQVCSPSPVTKGKASRAPRTGSAVVNSSPNFSRTAGTLDGWEQPSTLGKVQSMVGASNRKRPIPSGSSSPPMTQWVGQRPQKISRTRRANLVSPVSNHDDAQILPEGFHAPEIGGRLSSSEANGPVILRGASNNTQQFKMKFEHVPSPARLSESEESGAGENKLKEKGVDNDEIDDRSISAVEKAGSFSLPSKKNKLNKEEIGDGVRRQGRSGRGISMSRSCIPPVREKLENAAMSKALPSMRTGPDKTESKSGRPPSKKLSDRKAFNRPGHPLNSGSSDMTGESDDDHEELLAAAKSVHNARYVAYTGPFWKKVEPIFASISSEHKGYLKRQLNFADELDESLQHMFGADSDVLGELVHKEVPSSESLVSREKQEIKLNGFGQEDSAQKLSMTDQLSGIDTFGEILDYEKRCERVIPLYQRVLSALIGDDEAEEYDHNVNMKHASFQCDSSPSGMLIHKDAEPPHGDIVGSEIESEVDFRTQKHHLLDNFSCDGSVASNSFRSSSIPSPLYSDDICPGDESLAHSDVGVISGFSQNTLNGPQSLQSNNASVSSIECQYEDMSLEDRLLLELQSIGLYPEHVPDLAEGEDINKNIVAFKKGLYQQAGKKKKQLSRIDNFVQKEGEVDLCNLEQSAMNSLVEIAYKKRMACRGNNSKSGLGKISKKAALAFVKRTITRCQKFEDTGKSCFSEEPSLQDILFSAPPCAKEARFIDGAGTNTLAEVHNSQAESRTSAPGATSTLVERDGSSDAYQVLTHSPDQAFMKHEPLSNRGKKKEVLLDDVAGSAASRASSGLGSTLLGGAKGRRSERDRDQNKYMSTRNSVTKAGRPALGNLRGERKTKTKPKQKTAQLSTSGNGLLGRVKETTHPLYPTSQDSNVNMTDSGSKVNREIGIPSSGNIPQDSFKETEETADLTNLPLPEMDSIEGFGVSGNLAGHQDLSSWLNFDEDGLQDHDSMGLEIPMDDLSDLHMLI